MLSVQLGCRATYVVEEKHGFRDDVLRRTEVLEHCKNPTVCFT